MKNILEILKKTQGLFESRDIKNARLDAELLLSNLLGVKRLDLYLMFDKPLSEQVLNQFRQIVKRRANKEPLQHIIGEVDFFNLKLKSDKRALIPRQETEALVEIICDKNADKKDENLDILDLGTGSGAICLSLAKHFSNSTVLGVDKSEQALALASQNKSFNDIKNAVFIKSNWFDNINASSKFDIIVSNPPYLTEQEWLSSQDEVRCFDPKEALTSEEEGLSDIFKIIKNVNSFLKEGGFFALETGISQHNKILLLLEKEGFCDSQSVKDYAGFDRYIFAKK